MIVSEKRLDSRVKQWLRTRGQQDDQDLVCDLSLEWHSVRIVSHNARSCHSDGEFFRGHLIDYAGGAVAFGLPGLRSWRGGTRRRLDHEGQFVYCRWDAQGVDLSHDFFGTAVVMHSSGPGYVIVSDSLLAIVDFRRFLGDPCDFDREVLLSRSVLHNIAHTQLSPDTFITQVKFLPATQGLRIDLVPSMTTTHVGDSAVKQCVPPTVDYREGVRAAGVNIARLLHTLTRIGDWQGYLNLSGGYDSRVVLAGAIASGSLDRINVNCRNTAPSHRADYAVASMLAEVFGFRLNVKERVAPAVPARQVDCTPIGLFALSSLAVYDNFSLRSASRTRGNDINLNGIGAEVSRGNFGWRSWAQMADAFHVGSEVDEAFRAQGVAGLRAIGADPAETDATEWHYVGYRHALHAGRSTPLNLVGFQPLANRALVAVARSAANTHDRHLNDGASIISDLTALLSPLAAALPYDRPTKNLPFVHVAERSAALGGLDDLSVQPFDVHGSPGDVPAGPPEMLLRFIRGTDLNVPRDKQAVLKVAGQSLEVLQDDDLLLRTYRQLLKRARWRLLRQGAPIVGGGGDVGKLFAIRALAS